MGLLLDTSVVISAERRGHSVLEILRQIQIRHGEIDLALSVVSIAELMHGAYRAKTVGDKEKRLTFIDRLCNAVPVHPLTIEMARRIGRIEGEQASRGVVLPFEDLAISATALHLGFDVITLNVRHFQLIPSSRVVSE